MVSSGAIFYLVKKKIIGIEWMPIMALIFIVSGVLLINSQALGNNTFIIGLLTIIGGIGLLSWYYSLKSSKKK